MDWDAWALSYGLLIDSASGFVLLALGLAVALVARRARVTDRRLVVGLVTLLLLWGGFVALRNLEPPGTPAWRVGLANALGFAIFPAAVALALRFPRPVERRGPLVHATLVAALYLAARLLLGSADISTETGRTFALLAERAGFAFLLATLAARALREPEVRPAAFAATIAFGAYLGFSAGASVALLAGPTPNLVPVFYLAGLWLAVLLRTEGRDRRHATYLAWFLLGAVVASWLLASLTTRALGNNLGVNGLARIAGAAVLAYAVLRKDVLGLDVTVRFAVSKSTLAAVFIVAFFVAGEGAQIVFGEANEWVGLAAAGALVFALAPLQRAAERLAERAVPIAAARGGPAPIDRAESYRRSVRLAVKDRVLSREERLELAYVAHDLGLSAPAATRILHEVEDEESNRARDAEGAATEKVVR